MTGTAPEPASIADVVDGLLGRAITVLSQGPTASEPAVGRSADERVTATLVGDGTLHELELDPRVLRGTADSLAAAVMEAVNAAVDARTPGAGTAAVQRAEQLRALREDTLVQAGVLRTTLEGELNRLVADAREER